jgi:hypothetical protein
MDPPSPPIRTSAVLVHPDGAALGWLDTTGGVAFHDVERRAGAEGPFVPAGTSPPGTSSFEDVGLPRGESLAYRVRARDYGGASPWVPAPSVVTPPLPPEAPAWLAAEVLGPGSVRLTWEDRSAREEFVEVYREDPGEEFRLVATRGEDCVECVDGVRPDRTLRWRVVAGNVGGSSEPSNVASATMPGTFAFAVTRGRARVSTLPAGDSLRIRARLGGKGGAGAADLDPASSGLEVRLEGRDAPAAFRVDPGDPGWKVGKGKSTWKSARGAVPKAKVVVDVRRGRFSLALSQADLPAAPRTPVFVGVDFGPADAASRVLPWRHGRPGELKFP